MVKSENRQSNVRSQTKLVDIQTNRKQKGINTFLSYPGDDWLMSDELALQLFLNFTTRFTKSKSDISILIPGVGKSGIAMKIYKKGYHNLTIVDIEDDAILFQTALFQQHTKESSIKIFQCDMLNLDITQFTNVSYDLIIDKCFMDVFLRQGHSKLVWSNLCSLLSPTQGSILIYSMFHSKWKQLFQKNIWPYCQYASIHIPRYSRTRPTITRVSAPVAVFYAENFHNNNISQSLYLESLQELHENRQESNIIQNMMFRDNNDTLKLNIHVTSTKNSDISESKSNGSDYNMNTNNNVINNSSLQDEIKMTPSVLLLLDSIVYRNFHSITKNDFPIDASYF